MSNKPAAGFGGGRSLLGKALNQSPGRSNHDEDGRNGQHGGQIRAHSRLNVGGQRRDSRTKGSGDSLH